MLVLALTLALGLIPELRRGLRALVRSLIRAYAVAVVVAGPLLVYALIDFESESINEPRLFNGDLINVAVPTRLLGIGGGPLSGISARFPSGDAERGAYLGLPILIIIAWYSLRSRRTGAGRFLLAALGTSLLLTLGTSLTVNGHTVVALPWNLIARLPGFDNVLPVRFALFTSLAATVLVALWMHERTGRLRIALPALAVAALVPAVWHSYFLVETERHAFFTDGAYRCIPRNENIAIFSNRFSGDSMLWQAESGFWFRMASGYLRPEPPPDNLSDPTIQKLTFTLENSTMPEILALARRKSVDRILSVAAYAHPNGTQMHRFGVLQDYDGVLIAPACGYPALTPQSRLLPKWGSGSHG